MQMGVNGGMEHVIEEKKSHLSQSWKLQVLRASVIGWTPVPSRIFQKVITEYRGATGY